MMHMLLPSIYTVIISAALSRLPTTKAKGIPFVAYLQRYASWPGQVSSYTPLPNIILRRIRILPFIAHLLQMSLFKGLREFNPIRTNPYFVLFRIRISERDLVIDDRRTHQPLGFA